MTAPSKRTANRIALVCLSIVGLGAIAFALSPPLRRLAHPVVVCLRGRTSVSQRLEQYGEAASDRFLSRFADAGVEYPAPALTLVAFKEERRLDVFAETAQGRARFICSYPVLGASGRIGPKLREGDRQVPEGLYRIVSLNPDSRFHLSLKLDYPNEFDRRMAAQDGRDHPGSDIFIHGGRASIGCLAMGDQVIEELFVMVAESGLDHVTIIIAPIDLRTGAIDHADRRFPPWTVELYGTIRNELMLLPIPDEEPGD